MNDLISVIVPVYNIYKYITKCIHSILNQRYSNLEIILIDDGSADGSGAICDELAVTDNRIHSIHKENEGLAEARNTGLKMAKGKYIVFVDGDDYIEEDMLQKLYQRMIQDQSDLVFCNIHFVDENGNYIYDKEQNLEDCIMKQKEFWEGYHGSFVYPYVVSWNKLYKRELFEHTVFEKGKIHEDEFILHKIISQCSRISVVKDRLYNYVQRKDSIMNSKYDIRRLQGFDALDIRLDYFNAYDQSWIGLTIGRMFVVLLMAAANLDLSVPDNKYKLKEYIRVYKKRFTKYHKDMDTYLILKSLLFLYARPMYLLLRKKAYTNE